MQEQGGAQNVFNLSKLPMFPFASKLSSFEHRWQYGTGAMYKGHKEPIPYNKMGNKYKKFIGK